jgi:hypothetical protein
MLMQEHRMNSFPTHDDDRKDMHGTPPWVGNSAATRALEILPRGSDVLDW